MEREKLGSRLGFILLSAGCAIGIGNVWKFPYMVGQNGGAVFVLIYLFFLLVLGIPVLTMEFSLGRASQKSPARMYQVLEPKGTRWHLHSHAAIAGNYMIMMFYTTVAAWMVQYFVSMAAGDFVGHTVAQVATDFETMKQNPVSMTFYVALIIALGFLVCSLGLQKGLERITKGMMLALLGIMILLVASSVTMEGGAEGLAFYLKPDLEQIKEAGLGNVIVAAMNQSFFTLSLGMGGMAIFGSYIDKKRSLLGESVNVAVLDTFVALASGFIIFPTCSAYGVEVNSGPSLIFITLPNIFNNMPFGRLWGSLFFVFMSFAALSTVLAVFEVIIASTADLFGWSRKRACLINGVVLFLLSMPCVLGFSLWSGVQPFGPGTNIMDLEDFLVSNIVLPLGSLCFVLFCASRYGWGWNSFKDEANTGKGLKVADWMRGYMTYVLPVIILLVFVVGIYQFFA